MGTSSLGPDGGAAVRAQRPNRRVAELDGLRGLAALSVVVYHWFLVDPANHGGPYGPSLTAGMNWLYATPLYGLVAGQSMVLLFFVLSGFVLSLAWSDARQRVWRYLVARALRLYPLAWAASAIALVSISLLGGSSRSGSALWVSLMLHSRLPSAPHLFAMIWPFGTMGIDGPMWSLEQELRLSLLLPVLVWGARRVPAWLLTLCACSLIIEATMRTSDLSSWAWTPAAVGSFVLGIQMAGHRSRLNQWWRGLGTPTRFVVGVAVLVSFWIPDWANTSPLVQTYLKNLLPTAGACALIIAAQNGGLRQRLRSRPVVWLGRISYSLYLIHVVVLRLLVQIAPAGVPALALAPVGIVLSLALAEVLQRTVEKPGIQLGRRLKRASRPQAIPAPVMEPAGSSPG
jgi:peptidoglycan/LPS O-acetylase OafA/YrhL